MKILCFDSDQAVRNRFDADLPSHTLVYIDGPLSRGALSDHADAEIISIFTTSSFTKEDMDVLPALKCIVARSTGVDHIDRAAAHEKGILVSNVPKYGARTVAEFTFALMLTLSRRIFDAFHQLRESGNFATAALEGFDLYGKTLGVIGTGAIGSTVVKIAQGFGMRVRMYDLYPNQSIADENARYVDMDDLLATSDIITLHIPYTKENHHLLSMAAFAKMKKGVFLINTARGELIDTEALVQALHDGTVAGAGLDVLEEERALKDEIDLVKGIESIHALKVLINDHVLIDLPRVIITPHIAFFSREAYEEILTTASGNIRSFIIGAPTNSVSV